jgi:class 3 adenylate cyclase
VSDESLESSRQRDFPPDTSGLQSYPKGTPSATVVFSDLSGYTEMNEQLDPEEVEGIMSRIKKEACA